MTLDQFEKRVSKNKWDFLWDYLKYYDLSITFLFTLFILFKIGKALFDWTHGKIRLRRRWLATPETNFYDLIVANEREVQLEPVPASAPCLPNAALALSYGNTN